MDTTVIAPVGAAAKGSVSDSANLSEANSASVEAAEAKRNDDLVKYETYKRVLNEKKKLEERLTTFEAQREAQERKTLEEQNNFKALYETTAQKKTELEKQIEELTGVINNSIKTSHVIDALNRSNLKCVDFDALFQLGNTELLQLNGETVEGVNEFIEDARKTRPWLFSTQAMLKQATVPPAFATGANPITREQFLALPKEDQQRYLESKLKTQG
jgi:hypothetical protein